MFVTTKPKLCKKGSYRFVATKPKLCKKGSYRVVFVAMKPKSCKEGSYWVVATNSSRQRCVCRDEVKIHFHLWIPRQYLPSIWKNNGRYPYHPFEDSKHESKNKNFSNWNVVSPKERHVSPRGRRMNDPTKREMLLGV